MIELCLRWPEVVPLQAMTTSATCQALLDFFSRYEVQELICRDQGTNFTAALTRELTEKLGVEVRFSMPEHPQTNSLVEMWNGTFRAMLKHVFVVVRALSDTDKLTEKKTYLYAQEDYDPSDHPVLTVS